MVNGLIGYTGLVGQNLEKQSAFDLKFNSKNIDEIRNKQFDKLFCAGVSALKWWANRHPDDDLFKICRLLNALRDVSVRKFILISTVDVYKSPRNVDETTPIITEGLHAYGIHRRMVETFVKERFRNHHIIRFPHLFGYGLKKNIIFDFIHDNQLENIHSNAILQFYSLDTLYADIQKVIHRNIRLMNFATEPILVKEMVAHAFGREFNNITYNNPVKYDMKTIHANVFGSDSMYIRTKKDTLDDIKRFVLMQKDSG